MYFTRMVDSFSIRFNHRLPIYVSPVRNPAAWAIDALGHVPRLMHFLLFPFWSESLGRPGSGLYDPRCSHVALSTVVRRSPGASHVPPVQLLLRRDPLVQPRSGIRQKAQNLSICMRGCCEGLSAFIRVILRSRAVGLFSSL